MGIQNTKLDSINEIPDKNINILNSNNDNNNELNKNFKKKSKIKKEFNIVLVGPTYSGKTTLFNCLFESKFYTPEVSTTSTSHKENVIMNDGADVNYYLWDTPCLLIYEEQTKNSLIKNKDIYIIVFDVKDKFRFDRVYFWLESIKEINPNAPIILLGNKCEEDEKPREISKEFALDLASKNNSVYFETSAKNILEVKITFMQIINYAYNKLTGKLNSKEKDLKNLENEKNIEINNTINNITDNSKLILEKKIKELENKISELNLLNENLKKQVKELQKENNKTIDEKILEKKDEEINELKNKNKELEQKINNLKNLSPENYEKNNILELIEEIRQKDKEIKELKSNLPFELSKGEKLMSVIFISSDQKIHHSIICKNTDKFNRLENVLYNVEEYKEFLNSDNYFLVRGRKINKYLSLDENGIKNSDIIMLNSISED